MELHRIGRYLITEVLGRGAAGVVYRAHDPVIDREIALKAVPTDDADPDAVEFRARFLREARAAGRLNHPGIVTVYDVGEDEDHELLYLTMEYIRGCSLKEVIAADTRLDDAEIVALSIRLAEALDVAHRHGVVHRDLKPANVLISGAGEIKLVDFGVARLDTSDLTKDGSSVGTPFYMSPEQIFGRTVDGRSDLYGLGVILYELLSGRRPFSATGIGDLAVQIADDEPPDLGELRPELAASLAPIVHRLLAKRPEDRYQSGQDLAEALRAFEVDQEGTGLTRAVERVRSRSESGSPENHEGPPEGPDPLDTQALHDAPTTFVRRRRSLLAVTLVATVAVAVTVVSSHRLRSGGPETPAGTAAADAQSLHDEVMRLREAADRLEAGDVDRARELAEDVLTRRPTSDAAGKILKDAVAATDGPDPIDTATATPTPERRRGRGAPGASAATPTPSPSATPTPRPRPAILEVVFATPLTEGSLVVEVDFERIEEIRWDSSDPGSTPPGSGVREVHADVEIPVGVHQLEIQLHTGRRGQIGMGVFERDFAPASRWRVVVDLPDRRARPSFALDRIEPGP